MNANKAISFVTAVMVTLLSVVSFALSYSALRNLALSSGAVIPALAWAWPLVVDGAMLVFSMTILRASLYGERTWTQWALVASFSALSVALNVIHAPSNPVAWIVAGVSPVALLLSFESLMSQIRTSVKRHAVSQSLSVMESAVSRARSELVELEKKADAMTAVQLPLPENDAKRDAEPQSVTPAKAERHALILGIIAQDGGIKYQDLAARVGVSLPTVKRDMAELLDTGRVKRNGHGLEPVSIIAQ